VRLFTLDRLRKIGDDVERGWPGYLFGGHVRTSTLVLIIAFAALWWIYDGHQPSGSSQTTQVPATQVVPPGYVPDPNYTWVPRSRLQQPSTVTVTKTPTSTPTSTTPPTTTTTSTTPPPFQLPVLPPPFGPGSATTTSPPPGPAPETPAAPPPG
jgi:hypothetical protein